MTLVSSFKGLLITFIFLFTACRTSNTSQSKEIIEQDKNSNVYEGGSNLTISRKVTSKAAIFSIQHDGKTVYEWAIDAQTTSEDRFAKYSFQDIHNRDLVLWAVALKTAREQKIQVLMATSTEVSSLEPFTIFQVGENQPEKPFAEIRPDQIKLEKKSIKVNGKNLEVDRISIRDHQGIFVLIGHKESGPLKKAIDQASVQKRYLRIKDIGTTVVGFEDITVSNRVLHK